VPHKVVPRILWTSTELSLEFGMTGKEALMTEAEWLAGVDPRPLWEFIRCTISRRKTRLLACACCRSIWHLLADERSRWAVEVGERLADGLAEPQEIKTAYFRADAAVAESTGVVKAAAATAADRVLLPGDQLSFYGLAWYYSTLALGAERLVAAGVGPKGLKRWWEEKTATDWRMAGWIEPKAGAIICQRLRDIVGNPFCLLSLPRSWLTPASQKLARWIYEKRSFDRLPLLADALKSAGCTNQAILQHCRQQGEHVRGCWLLDLLLGKQ
jgi:hypothetical protein